jgi:hypothetical protein
MIDEGVRQSTDPGNQQPGGHGRQGRSQPIGSLQVGTEEIGEKNGSGQEYRILDVLEGRTEPLVIPLDFPDAPDVDNPELALNASLAELRHWYLAPTSPGQLSGAGVRFAITTDGLSSLNEFLPNLRIAVARGLSADDALAALTTTPADWLGIDRTHGTIEAGKVANLVVTEGDLFTEEATVRDVWVQGKVYGVTRPA